MTDFSIQPIEEAKRDRIRQQLIHYFGASRMVTRGRLVDAAAFPGFLAYRAGEPIGVITYEIAGDACEIIVLQSLVEGIGVGSALIGAVKEVAQQAGCRRLWLITTNDNTPALRFYQKRGFLLAALHRNALEESRRLKPEIPLLGQDGIPIRDEIELEILL